GLNGSKRANAPTAHGGIKLFGDYDYSEKRLGYSKRPGEKLKDDEEPRVRSKRRRAGEQGVGEDCEEQNSTASDAISHERNEEGRQGTKADHRAQKAEPRLWNSKTCLDLLKRQREQVKVVLLEE